MSKLTKAIISTCVSCILTLTHYASTFKTTRNLQTEKQQKLQSKELTSWLGTL